MSWIDIAILGLVVLFGLFGVLRGVKKSALSVGAFVIAFMLAFFLSHVVAEALLGIDGIKNFVLGNGFGESDEFSLAKWLYASNVQLPVKEGSYLYTHFYEPIWAIMSKSSVIVDSQQGFAIYGAFLLFSAICGVGLFIVARFLLIIATAIVKSFISKKKTVLSRLLGFVVGAVEGGLIALSVAVVFTSMGGYTFFTPIANVEAEFSRSVFSRYINDGAYGMRNMMLPDSDTYGRLVNMVITPSGVPEETEKLSGDRLGLYIDLGNVNYENEPWSIDENRHRKFDADNALARDGREFQVVDFDEVTVAILEYNARVAQTVDDTTKMTGDVNFAMLRDLVKKTDSTETIDSLMTELWRELRTYKNDYLHPDPDAVQSVQISTLSSDYGKICATVDKLKAKYAEFEEDAGAFPEINLPGAKTETGEGVTDPYQPPDTPTPDDPTVDPDDPTVDPDDPTVDPDDPTVDPDDPTVNPDDPTVNPDDPTVNPDDPTVNPDDPNGTENDNTGADENSGNV